MKRGQTTPNDDPRLPRKRPHETKSNSQPARALQRLERRAWSGLTCAALFPLLPLAMPNQASAGDLVPRSPKLSFNRDIRPILAENCFKCHGPDAKQRKGKLRLDDERAAKGPAGSGSIAIVPGKVEESELYLRITAEDADERMPPKDSGKSLRAR